MKQYMKVTMSHIGMLPATMVAETFQCLGPNCVLRCACASRRLASAPESARYVTAARRLYAIAAGIRASHDWSDDLWPSEFRACRSITMAAVTRWGLVREYAASELRADKEVVLAASELRADKEVVLAAVAQNGFALKYAAPDLQADKEVVLAAVAQNGCALGYTAVHMRADKEVVLTAVAQNGHVLEYAAAEMQVDREVVLAAVAQHFRAALRSVAALRQETRNLHERPGGHGHAYGSRPAMPR